MIRKTSTNVFLNSAGFGILPAGGVWGGMRGYKMRVFFMFAKFNKLSYNINYGRKTK